MKISTIYTMPAARFPIRSFLRDTSAREAIYRFIEAEIAKGAAAYIICPSIENNEELELAGVLDYAENLQKQFPNWKIAYLYGAQAEKEGVMQDFVEGRTDVLVSTTVVEVGVHVPRATVMLIENAERFGLAQLHQLRGRVGRGNRQSYCIFLTESKEKRAMDKLEFITNHASGFEVAEYDLKMRGAGDAYGVRQHGVPMLKLADLYSDLPMLEIVQKAKHEIPESEEIRTLAELSGNSQKRILSL